MQKLYILTLMYFLVNYIPLKALKTKVEVQLIGYKPETEHATHATYRYSCRPLR